VIGGSRQQGGREGGEAILERTMSERVMVLDGERETVVERSVVEGDELWLRADDLAATGWELKPEGVCRDEVCVPLSGARERELLREESGERWMNATGFARHAGQPVAQETARRVWAFGAPAHEVRRRAVSDVAPDFTLPDFQGRERSLSEFRGKKVFLLTWASW
jgi:hypothetical protein